MSRQLANNGFEFRPFRPLPFLGNPHVQTVLGSVLAPGKFTIPCRIWHIRLADGDCLAIHETLPRSWQPGQAITVLIHGLGGCHRSGHMLRLARQFHALGLRTIRLDLRGVGAGETLARRTYHGGCSGDVRAVVEEIHRQHPTAPIIVVGMSLGGNIALKLAGEAADHPLPGLRAVAALGPPIDMVRCAALLAKKRNRLYERYYVGNLVKQVRQHRRHFADLPLPRFVPGLTLRQFDDLYTAPTWGFADAMDYYRRASALDVVAKIQVPCFVLVSRDDPFIAIEPFEELGPGPGRTVHLVDRGGHLGFLGWDGAGGIRWAENVIARWVVEQL